MKKKCTIYDIARESGFSPKTVSRVINGEENVKKETRDLINEIITKFSYTPNIYAKNLTKKQSTNILISVKKKDSFPLIWFHTLLDKILFECKKRGLNTIVEYFGEDDRIADSILSGSGSIVDGVVVFYESKDDIRVQYLKNNNVPFIVFGKSLIEDVKYVTNNDYKALYEMSEKYIKNESSEIWLLMGSKSNVNLDRTRGVLNYYEDNKMSTDKLNVVYGLTTIESVYEYSIKYLKKSSPKLVFVSGDEKVQGLIRACYELKIVIPEHLEIIGFDNIPISNYYTPSLTTISPDYDRLSSSIIQGLINIINGVEFKSLEIDTKNIKRNSTK